MRQNYNQEYSSPVLESIDLEVEKGFAQSGNLLSTGYADEGTAGSVVENIDYGFDL